MEEKTEQDEVYDESASIDDMRHMAEAAFRTGSHLLTWLLWEMREQRRYGPVRKGNENELTK